MCFFFTHVLFYFTHVLFFNTCAFSKSTCAFQFDTSLCQNDTSLKNFKDTFNVTKAHVLMKRHITEAKKSTCVNQYITRVFFRRIDVSLLLKYVLK